jgi:hypothetical protein
MSQSGSSHDTGDSKQSDLSGFISEAEHEDKFPIHISYDILRQVSSQLYTNPRRAIEELVCNSYDAAATKCHVSTPDDADDVLQVLDNGISMNKDELENLWEVAGGEKKKLAEEGKERTIDAKDVEGRKQIGRFGVGKLAAFALGNELTHVATKDGVTRIISVSQQEIEGHDMEDPPEAEVYRMDEDEAKDHLGSYLDDVPDPWEKGWDSWTLAVVDDIDEESSGRDLKPEYLNKMIRTAIPRAASFTTYLNNDTIEPQEYPDDHYAQIDNLANDEDAREKVEETIKNFWVDLRDSYDEPSDVPESKYKLDTVYVNPYEESVDDQSEQTEDEDPESDESGRNEEENDDESNNQIKAVQVPELGPVIASGTIYENLLNRNKLEDRNLHDYGFKIKVRGKLLNRGDPLFGTSDKAYKWFYRFKGEFEIPELDDDILVQRDSVRESLKTELSRELMESFFSVLRRRANEAEEKEEYDPEEFGHRLHSISPHLAPKALEGLADLDDTDYPDSGWKDVDVHLAEHGRDKDAVRYHDGTIYVNEDHPLFQSLKAKDLPNELIKVVGEALAGNLISSGYLSYKEVREDLVDESIDISEDALRTASRFIEDPIEYHKEQIQEMSYEGDTEFEEAIVDAMDHIGLEAEHYGDSGDSDAIITFGVQGDEPYKISVEAKGCEEGNGPIDHSKADFSTAIEHMEADGCDHTLFVARDFQLEGQSEDSDSKLINHVEMYDELTCLTVNALIEILDRHSKRGFSHERIREIMTAEVLPRDEELLELIETEWNKMPNETGIVKTVLKEARQQYMDETDDKPDIGMVRYALRDSGQDSITKEKIRSVLSVAEADTGMVSFNPVDDTFSVHQKPEVIIKEMQGNSD